MTRCEGLSTHMSKALRDQSSKNWIFYRMQSLKTLVSTWYICLSNFYELDSTSLRRTMYSIVELSFGFDYISYSTNLPLCNTNSRHVLDYMGVVFPPIRIDSLTYKPTPWCGCGQSSIF